MIPDFIANAGGVICAAVEFQGGDERLAFDSIDTRIRASTRTVLEDSRRANACRAPLLSRSPTQTRRWH